MTEPLENWIIYLSFYAFLQLYRVYPFFNAKTHIPYEMSFYQIPIKFCNMAIYCNTLEHNTQYGIDLYCFTSSTYDSTLLGHTFLH